MKRTLIVLVALCLALPSAPAAAQPTFPRLLPTTAPAAESSPPAAAKPTAVATAAIPWRARDAEVQLHEMESSLQNRALEDVTRQLPGLFEDMAELNQPGETSSMLARRRQLYDLLVASEGLRTRLYAWQKLARARTELILGYKLKLQGLTQTWALTEAALRAQNGGGAAALVKVQEVERAISSTQAELDIQTDRLFELNEHLNDAQGSLDARIEVLRDAQSTDREQLTSRDQEPLWVRLGDPDLPPLRARNGALQGLRAAWATYHSQLPLQLFVLVLGLAALRVLAARARARLLAAAKPVPAVLERPVLSGLLISLILARFVYTKATLAALDMLAILSLAVLGWLAGALTVTASARRLLRALVVALILYGLCALLYLNDPWFELALLISTVPLFGVLVWAARLLHKHQVAFQSQRLARIVPLFLRAALAGLGLALLAGLLGYRTALEYLLEGVALSAHWLVLSVTLTRLLSAFVSVAFDAGRIAQLGSVRRHGETLRGRALWGVNALGIALWCVATLHAFELLLPAQDLLQRCLNATASIGSWRMSLGGLVTFVLALYLSAKLASLVSFFLDEDILPRLQLTRGVPPTISRLTRYVIQAVGLLFAIGATGVDMSKLALVASALSVGIGFGLQNVVNNFVSGLIIIFERPVRVGDTIQLGDLQGDVQSIGFRASTIRTPQGAEAILPNAELISSRLINWTLSDPQRRIDLPIVVPNGSDPRRVLDVLTQALQGIDGVASFPAPNCSFLGFGETALNFEVQLWAQRGDEFGRVRSAVVLAVSARLAEAGIKFPFPQGDPQALSLPSAPTAG